MSWNDAARRLSALAACVALAAHLSACARPAGEFHLPYAYGESLDASFEMQEDRAAAARRLDRAFGAQAQRTVTFAFDDASLDAAARAALDGQAAWLRAHPDVPMMVVGHTDLVGPERYNQGLGLRRAKSVVAHLTERGVAPERLVAIESRGEQDPVVPVAGREPLNRRAVTAVAARRAEPGPGLDGTYAARLYDAYQSGLIGVTEADPIEVN